MQIFDKSRLLFYDYCYCSFMTVFLSYKNQSIDFVCKSIVWFLYDRDLRHERVKVLLSKVLNVLPKLLNVSRFLVAV